MSQDFADYTKALDTLASLTTRADAERAQIERSSAARMDHLDRDWRSARAEFDSVSDKRNRVQREVSALSREIGPVPAATTAEVGQYRSVREIDAALDDLARRTERARKDWQWAQRYLERARTATAITSVPVIAPPPTPAAEPAEPEASRSVLSKPSIVVLGVVLLILVVVIALVVV